jgi:hypothetical protein
VGDLVDRPPSNLTRMKRLLLALLAFGLLGSLAPTPGLAWSNGTGGCNSYGTHDWVLDQALQAVGERAGWVRTRAALRATDDPDCVDGVDHASGTWWHVYDRWGAEYGGADEAAAVWFRRTERRLANGNERGASRALGILSHFVGDVAQPMHTDSSDREDRVHGLYEDAVDRRIERFRFNYNGADVARAAATVRSVARRAHRHYRELVRNYDVHGYNARVARITRRQLNRAAQAMADLITSLR